MMFFCTWVVPPAMRPPGAPSRPSATRARRASPCGAGEVGSEHGGVEEQLGDAELGERRRHRRHAGPAGEPRATQRPAAADELGHRAGGRSGRRPARPAAMPVEPRWMRACSAQPMWPRSLVSVAMATVQPSCSGPSRASAGRRTSSRNTSSNSEPPVIWRSGRTSMPGGAMSTRKNEMPLCFGASSTERVRARQMPQSATRPFEHHTFWPVSTQASPSRVGRGRQRGEVAAGAGLAEELAPDLARRRRCPGRCCGLLLGGAEREEGAGGEDVADHVEERRHLGLGARARSTPPCARR